MNVQLRSLSHRRRILAPPGPWYDPNNEGLAVVCAYKPKGAASYAASLQNIYNPGTNDATEGTAPAWDADNGWKFTAGSSHYLIAPIPTSAYSLFVQFSNDGAVNDTYLCGMGNVASQRLGLQAKVSSSHRYWNNSSQLIAGALTSGNLALLGTNHGLYNGTVETTDGFTGVASALALYLGALNWKGGPSAHWTGYMQAFALYSATLTQAQGIAIQTAMAAL